MKKLILVLFLLTIGCKAQSGPGSTVYQTLAKDSQSNASQWGAVKNVGQVSHQADLILADAPAHTCNTGSVTVSMKFYGSNFLTNGPGLVLLPQTQLTSSNFGSPFTGNAISIQASGAYPAVYILLSISDLINCKFSLYYNGSINGSPVIDLANQNIINFHQDGFAGTYTVNSPSGNNAGVFANVYEETISLSAAGNALVLCNGVSVDTYFIAANTSIVLPSSKIPWQSCPGNETLAIQLSATGAFTVKYKLEH